MIARNAAESRVPHKLTIRETYDRLFLAGRHLADHTGRWKPISADGITLLNLEKVGITRYRYRGAAIPNPWTETRNGNDRGEPVALKGARRVR